MAYTPDGRAARLTSRSLGKVETGQPPAGPAPAGGWARRRTDKYFNPKSSRPKQLDQMPTTPKEIVETQQP